MGRADPVNGASVFRYAAPPGSHVTILKVPGKSARRIEQAATDPPEASFIEQQDRFDEFSERI